MKEIKLVQAQFPGISRSQVKKLLAEEVITISNNGDIQTDWAKLRQSVAEIRGAKPASSPLRIIYEDADTLVVNKPAGVAMHDTSSAESLVDMAKAHMIFASSNPFGEAKPVHRLDKVTSGVVVFAKSALANAFYSRQFKKREVKKTYLAVVKGDFREFLANQDLSELTVQSDISTRPHNRRYYSVPKGEGEHALTRITFLRYWQEAEFVKSYCLICAEPETGRSQQIRVHLSESGFPIIGDEVYGGEVRERVFLHAYRLTLKLFPEAAIKEFVAEVGWQEDNPVG